MCTLGSPYAFRNAKVDCCLYRTGEPYARHTVTCETLTAELLLYDSGCGGEKLWCYKIRHEGEDMAGTKLMELAGRAEAKQWRDSIFIPALDIFCKVSFCS